MFRLWKSNRETARLLGVQELWVLPIIRIIVESAALFTTGTVVAAGVYAAGLACQIIVGAMVRLIVI